MIERERKKEERKRDLEKVDDEEYDTFNRVRAKMRKKVLIDVFRSERIQYLERSSVDDDEVALVAFLMCYIHIKKLRRAASRDS